MVWDLPGGVTWVGPRELLWVVKDYVENLPTKLVGRHLVVARVLMDCVENVIRTARSYHVGDRVLLVFERGVERSASHMV